MGDEVLDFLIYVDFVLFVVLVFDGFKFDKVFWRGECLFIYIEM